MLSAELRDRLRCPRCRGPLDGAPPLPGASGVHCANPDCPCHAAGFPVVDDQPVLIDFERSVVTREGFLARQGRSVFERDDSRTGLRMRVLELTLGDNLQARAQATRFAAEAKRLRERPRILVVGGGAIGGGTDALYADPGLELVGTDIYASRYTSLVADGHALPFADATFEGVWVQAVLEHVLEPGVVAGEIARVLVAGGLVYADTPFMQQVHEGAYDFTRFTKSGHRWLFRGFEEIASGAVGGPGASLIWAIRYFVRALTGSGKLATAVSLAFFWLRFLDRLARAPESEDGACGLYFLGRKSGAAMGPKDIVAYYEQGRVREPRAEPSQPRPGVAAPA